MDYAVTENGVSRTDIPIQRITWSDGRWWDVLATMPTGVSDDMRAAMSVVSKARVIGDSIQSVPDPEHGADAWINATAKARYTRLTGCTVAWAWDDPVSESMIREMPSSRVNDVRKVLDDLHADDFAETTPDEKKSYPSPSSIGSHSGVNGSQPSSISTSSTAE